MFYTFFSYFSRRLFCRIYVYELINFYVMLFMSEYRVYELNYGYGHINHRNLPDQKLQYCSYLKSYSKKYSSFKYSKSKKNIALSSISNVICVEVKIVIKKHLYIPFKGSHRRLLFELESHHVCITLCFVVSYHGITSCFFISRRANNFGRTQHVLFLVITNFWG